jgi:hypothetical protein
MQHPHFRPRETKKKAAAPKKKKPVQPAASQEALAECAADIRPFVQGSDAGMARLSLVYTSILAHHKIPAGSADADMALLLGGVGRTKDGRLRPLDPSVLLRWEEPSRNKGW